MTTKRQRRRQRGKLLAAVGRDKPSRLTAAGWPRPVIGGWPIPWVSPSDALSKLDDRRLKRIRARVLCQVCGEGHEPDATVFLVCNGLVDGTAVEADITDKTVIGMDHGVLHRKCLRLAVAMCPVLKALNAGRNLVLVATRARDAAAFHANADPYNQQMGVLGRDVLWVGWSLEGAPE